MRLADFIPYNTLQLRLSRLRNAGTLSWQRNARSDSIFFLIFLFFCPRRKILRVCSVRLATCERIANNAGEGTSIFQQLFCVSCPEVACDCANIPTRTPVLARARVTLSFALLNEGGPNAVSEQRKNKERYKKKEKETNERAKERKREKVKEDRRDLAVKSAAFKVACRSWTLRNNVHAPTMAHIALKNASAFSDKNLFFPSDSSARFISLYAALNF